MLRRMRSDPNLRIKLGLGLGFLLFVTVSGSARLALILVGAYIAVLLLGYLLPDKPD